MSDERRHFGDTELGQWLGITAVVLAFGLIAGGCEVLRQRDQQAQRATFTVTTNEARIGVPKHPETNAEAPVLKP